MAGAAVFDTTPSTLLSLQPDEQRKILLQSLQAGYPCIPKVSRPVSSKVSRYVSQFTSGRWRERIWFSDDSDSSEDTQCETETRETKASRHLVIFGYDLHSEDYLKEREMIARWNIVERELHFPNLEKGYVQKRDAKTQSDVGVPKSCQTPTTQEVKIAQEPTTEDIFMEECQESSQKVPDYIDISTKVSEQESSIGNGESKPQAKELTGDIDVPAKVVLQESSCSVQESKPRNLGLDSKALEGIETSPQPESGKKNLVPNSESSIALGKKEPEEKMGTVPEISKHAGGPEKEMKTREAISPAEINHGNTSFANSKVSVIPNENEDRKEVSAVPDSKLSETSQMETSESTSAKSGDEISVPKMQFLATLEVKECKDKMGAGTVFEHSNVSSSEQVMETSEITSTESSTEKVLAPNYESLGVPEVKEPEKMEDETVPEHSKVARTSETDIETSGTTLRGKRKADSISEDDSDEKRTKKLC